MSLVFDRVTVILAAPQGLELDQFPGILLDPCVAAYHAPPPGWLNQHKRYAPVT